MRSTDWSRLAVTCAILALASLSEIVPIWAADPAVSLTYEQKEQFLKTARVVQQHSVSKGVTATVRDDDQRNSHPRRQCAAN
jgi:hypothetical protein